MSHPFLLTATEAVAQIRDGKLSPVDLVASCLARIGALEPRLHAWETLDSEGALESAHTRAKELESGRPVGPLQGVPVGIKDLFFTAGLRTSAGSKLLFNFVPTWDATMVARLKGAGAIVLGKTVTTEWAASDAPPTRNPWDPGRTPGGSSTGSAVAVATRMCPAATGTQGAGSVVRPAAYNGIVGLKPTFGWLSRRGIIRGGGTVNTPGILVRSVEDAALFLEVMAGHDPADLSTTTRPVPPFQQLLSNVPSRPRIGLIRQFLERATDEVRKHTESVAQRLGRAGADVVPVDFPDDLDTVLAAHWLVMKVESAAAQEKLFKDHQTEYSPFVRSHIEVGMLIPGSVYVQSLYIQRRFRQQVEALVADVDVVLAPSTGSVASRPEERLPTGDHAFQMPWTFAGVPAICLPSGLNEDGLPFSIQFIGTPFADDRLLAVARWCESILDVKLCPPVE